MKVNELIEKLESCDGERGDFKRVNSVEPDTSHEKEKNFVWLK